MVKINQNKLLLWITLISIFLSEILLHINETLGFVSYTLIITGILIVLSNLESLDSMGKLVIVLMIFPMIRILELFLQLSNYWRISIVYYLFLFLALYYFIRFKFEYKPKKGGFWWIILSIFLGVLFGFVGKGLFHTEKSLMFITIIPIIVFAEELFFRGMVQELITRNYGLSYGIILTALFYAIASLGFGAGLIMFFILLSLILSIIYGITKNLWLTIIINAIVHIFIFII